MKLVYLIAGTYRPAGMERVLANKTGWLADRGHEILVVTTDQKGRKPAFEFHPSIRFADLGIGYEDNNGRGFLSKLLNYPFKQIRHRSRLSRLLREEHADIVVSMFCNDASFVPRIKDGSRKVLEIHFSRFKRLQYGRRGVWALADRFRSWNDRRVAARFDRFVVLTEEDRGFWGKMDNISFIPNARTFAPESLPSVEERAHIVLAAGRLSAQKNFARLLDIWSLVKASGNMGDWNLRIAGDGEQLAELESKLKALGLSDSVTIGPASGADMLSLYSSSGIYALTSMYEGLPMVLLEAQAAGLPIVSVACKCGPRDVVTDGEDGFLIPDDNAPSRNQEFASRLLELMNDPGLRDRMGRAARKSSGRFDENRIMSQWERLFEELL